MKRLRDTVVLVVMLAACVAWAGDVVPSRLTLTTDPMPLPVATQSPSPTTSLRLLSYESATTPSDVDDVRLLPPDADEARPIDEYGRGVVGDVVVLPRLPGILAAPKVAADLTDREDSADLPSFDANDPALFEVGGRLFGLSSAGSLSATPNGLSEPPSNEVAKAFLRPRSTTGQPSRGYDVAQILALLEPGMFETAQSPPQIPRVLRPPDAALPPDPMYDTLREPPRESPHVEAQDDLAPHAPPRPIGEFDRFGSQAYSPGMSPQVGPFEPPQTHWPYYLGTEGQPTRGSRRVLSNRSRGMSEVYAGGDYWPAHDAFGRREPRRPLTPGFLARRDIALGGWIDQGVTFNAANASDGYNGPVTFNDRDDYQMNQLYFFLERVTDTRGGGFDFGGRIDFLYGTDSRFTQAVDGLESDWNQTERFYQAALPQIYLDVAYNDWTARLGHFYTPMGYEAVPAPDNFFYSHSYAFQYGYPRTYTGMLATRELGRGLSVSGGFTRGNGQFNDTDGLDQLAFLGGIDWRSRGGRLELGFNVSSGEQGPDNNTVIYSLVGQMRLTERLRWVLEHTYGQSAGGLARDGRMAEWYGISNYLLYDLRRNLSLGARVEWFRDEQGVAVHGLGDGNLATGPYPGSFQEITLGLNWQPRRNMVVRPEVRWDWFDGSSPVGHRPFDGGRRNSQFLTALDVIVQF